MDCENWTFVEICRVSGNFQKLPGGVEGPPGGSCLQNPFSGFSTMHCLTTKCCPSGDTLPSSLWFWYFRDVGALESDSSDTRLISMTNYCL